MSQPRSLVAHEWMEATTKLLTEYAEYGEVPRLVAAEVIRAAAGQDFDYASRRSMKPVVDVLLKRYFGTVWPALRKALISRNASRRFHLRHFLGTGSDEGKGEALLFGHHDEDLLAWCEVGGPEAIRTIAEMMPLVGGTREEPQWHKFALKMIDRYGDTEALQEGVFSNFGTMVYSGYGVTQSRREMQLYSALKDHRKAGVAAWAAAQVEYLRKRLAQDEKREKEHEAGIW